MLCVDGSKDVKDDINYGDGEEGYETDFAGGGQVEAF